MRDIQERAISAILDRQGDVILAAATAGGKTEAAFLPILSQLANDNQSTARGFDVLYVSPLKALINDQFKRLFELCELLSIPVHAWHGDISASKKAKARRNPNGVLLITPESLEAMFVLRGIEIPAMFGTLRSIVVDELHALMDVPRGMHLRSLLDRIEYATGRAVRRIGLSATLGDMRLASTYLRPSAPDAVEVLESGSEGQDVRIQVRGYRIGSSVALAQDQEVSEDVELASDRAVTNHLFEKLKGTSNLVFAGTRQSVELYSDLLRGRSEEEGRPNEFFPHHANLSREHRATVEERLKEASLPTTAVCTSTLELGIDIGAVESVAQVGAPFSVASLRQRLGRSGRRAGKPAILRAYIQEQALDSGGNPIDSLRLQLVQTIAMIELLRRGWCEPPRPHPLHLSTLVHQILSAIAERGGVEARTLFAILCQAGPFKSVDSKLFLEVLTALGRPETALIEQSPDGTLLLGKGGERLVEHHTYYAVFMTPEEYRVVCAGQTLGTLPVTLPLAPDARIIFSGRRWKVVAVVDRQKVIDVVPDPAGRPPRFGGDPIGIHDMVADEMFRFLGDEAVPAYLDSTARELVAEGRECFARLGLQRSTLVRNGAKATLLFPWRGTVRTETIALALRSKGLKATPRHVVIEADAAVEDVKAALLELSEAAPPHAVELARHIPNLTREKYHPYLTEELLIRDAAASRVDVGDMAGDAEGLLLGN